MAVSYKGLFHKLIDLDMETKDLMKKADISANIITRLKRNEYISMMSLESICCVLNCGVDDILKFKENMDEN